MKDAKNFWRSLGPGLLFAGSAVGVSHIVQSTQAGAIYGLGLFFVMILVNLAKYPGFRFGPQFATVTGMSLPEAYARMGKWVVLLFILGMLPSLAIIIAAVAITTSGMINAVLQLQLNATYTAIGLIIVSVILLYTGGYKLLELINKVFIVILTVATFVATAFALPSVEWTFYPETAPEINLTTLAFIIAFMGFMPAGMDLSVIQSLWTKAKARLAPTPPLLSNVMVDFNVGYIGTVILAACFIFMGAGVMHSQGIAPVEGAVAFSAQVINLYTSTLGEWSGNVVGLAAFAIIFTTLITILDGMPRTIAASILALQSEDGRINREIDHSRILLVTMIVMAVSSILILLFLMKSFGQFIILTTTMAFVLSPFIALLNHIAMHGKDVPADKRPPTYLTLWSGIGTASLFALAALYLYTQIL